MPLTIGFSYDIFLVTKFKAPVRDERIQETEYGIFIDESSMILMKHHLQSNELTKSSKLSSFRISFFFNFEKLVIMNHEKLSATTSKLVMNTSPYF